MIRVKLSAMVFLQFFQWGMWLITFGSYATFTLKMNGAEVSGIYALLGISAICMPGVAGEIADRWLDAKKLYGLCHLLCGALLVTVALLPGSSHVYWLMLGVWFIYMPTLGLVNVVSYTVLENEGYNIVNDFPGIRVWGTVGFIAGLWTTSLAGWELSANQLLIAGVVALVLGVYSFVLPKCRTYGNKESYGSICGIIVMLVFASLLILLRGNMIGLIMVIAAFFVVAVVLGRLPKTVRGKYGLEGFTLFGKTKTVLFLFFTLFIGAMLQISNSLDDIFMHDFQRVPAYANSFGVTHSAIVLSLARISEALFIIAIPFFMRKFGIKKVLIMAALAWSIRYFLFSIATPVMPGILFIMLANIVYGCAFDFFNIAGSIFTDMETEIESRAAAQGMFFNISNGFGGFLGSVLAGGALSRFSTGTGDSIAYNWQQIWVSFSGFALVTAVVFMFVFKYKHDPKEIEKFHH